MKKSSLSLLNKSSTLVSGIFAVGVYVFFISVLLVYFNTRDEKKPVHYVKKNEDSIRVTMTSPKNKVKEKTTSEKKPQNKKVVQKPKTKDTIKKQKDASKKVIKEKIVKKVKPKPKPKESIKKQKPKIVNKPKDLFANVSSTKKPMKKNIIQVSEKPFKASASNLVSSSLQIQKKSDRGIENAYLALIEDKLNGWPAQSDYAGEMAKVWIKVKPSGHFIFKVITASENDNFNIGLIAYLEQLQDIGFGPHKSNRAYELNVEFIAKE